MDNKFNLNEMVEQIKNTEDNITKIFVPMLKDTVNDYKKVFKKLILVIVLLILVMAAVFGYSQYLIYKQNEKYYEFLSQFEFESETIYQDVDAGDGSDSIINDGINIQGKEE